MIGVSEGEGEGRRKVAHDNVSAGETGAQRSVLRTGWQKDVAQERVLAAPGVLAVNYPPMTHLASSYRQATCAMMQWTVASTHFTVRRRRHVVPMGPLRPACLPLRLPSCQASLRGVIP